MVKLWILESISQMISNQIQESLNLEYKAAGALEQKTGAII
jgi:hypothetical protein